MPRKKTAPTDPLVRLQLSLRRRDRRIAQLKKLLKLSRAEISQKRDIIDGLERALLMHRPVVDENPVERIAELESQLAEMTALVEILDDSDPIQESLS